MGRYAMTYADTAAVPQTVTQTPAKLGYISTYTLAVGAEAVAGNNSLRVRVPGSYLVQADIALTTDVEDNFYVSIYRNGSPTGFRNGSLVGIAGLGFIHVHGILSDINVNDVLELYINSGSNSSFSVTVNAAQFSMVQV